MNKTNNNKNYKRVGKNVYKTAAGTYRVRKTVNGTMFSGYFDTLKQANSFKNKW